MPPPRTVPVTRSRGALAPGSAAAVRKNPRPVERRLHAKAGLQQQAESGAGQLCAHQLGRQGLEPARHRPVVEAQRAQRHPIERLPCGRGQLQTQRGPQVAGLLALQVAPHRIEAAIHHLLGRHQRRVRELRLQPGGEPPAPERFAVRQRQAQHLEARLGGAAFAFELVAPRAEAVHLASARPRQAYAQVGLQMAASARAAAQGDAGQVQLVTGVEAGVTQCGRGRVDARHVAIGVAQIAQRDTPAQRVVQAFQAAQFVAPA